MHKPKKILQKAAEEDAGRQYMHDPVAVNAAVRPRAGHLPPAHLRVAKPEHDGQHNHKEGMGAQVGRHGKVRIEDGRADMFL